MLLACDIGNTRIKAGLFEENVLTEYFCPDSLSSLIEKIDKENIRDIAVSSVVPSITKELKDSLSKFNLVPFIISNHSRFNLEIQYETPETLGTDRICSAEGAFFLYSHKRQFRKNQAIVSIDFGTATTFNVVEYPGTYIGGIIAPGIDLMFKSLSSNTAQLPLVYLTDYKKTIGKTTNESIASGVMNSAAGLIERGVDLIKAETGAKKIVVYITGGNFKNIRPFLNLTFIHEKALVLYGINAIYNCNTPAFKTGSLKTFNQQP
jgi:type III pantothenate kinase